MRLIDADELTFDRLTDSICQGQAEDVVAEAPTIDAVPVVRCGECKHYDKFSTWSACTYWSGDPYEQASVNDDDFCSYGERRMIWEYT